MIGMTIRTQAEDLFFIPRDKYPDGQKPHDEVKARSKPFDDVVVLIGVGGCDSGALCTAMMLSDAILIAFIPQLKRVGARGYVRSD